MPRAIAISGPAGKPGQVYYALTHVALPPTSTPLQPNSLRIRISAAALNHRDLFIRQHLYPGTAFAVPLLADGCGVVTATGSAPSAQHWLGQRVVLCPCVGWASDAHAPEDGGKAFAILGGTSGVPLGTLSEEVVVDAGMVEPAPPHLSDAQAAALPLAGLTAYRAVVRKAGLHVPSKGGRGKRVLVTGIGGGVAQMAALFAGGKGAGAEVWVTSGTQEKLERARRDLGVCGGVVYKEETWERKLLALLPEGERFDVVIDGAGGDVVDKGVKLLKPGGAIVIYGMTLGPAITYSMGAVLRNISVLGTTMGSRAEFAAMVAAVAAAGGDSTGDSTAEGGSVGGGSLAPIVSRAVSAGPGLRDLAAVDALFEDMKAGTQFGKLVVLVEPSDDDDDDGGGGGGGVKGQEGGGGGEGKGKEGARL
ncbi:uncharacterized protein K452DRAFT_237092 [Aplosporella prunicola CBS 121167]|uniref:Enoyl reductase (ER) domain-containing protein n=1 Tax=Aplosporella prunicola CBS 121167 TaxID=1176127 RepID=A0A6A6B0B5_9PEZI|nr:uncharacterized protein K452DRAFT_237092 [Aplosporella prunicola CBS 121167]KAF2136684.1 hypothetical protein K452DRAFT_237092 [Aplosporella prunicola CBS 121167]